MNSDIDICVIQKDEGEEGEDLNLKELYKRILRVSANKRYDIVIFNVIPGYLRGEILENNEVLYAENADELDFWLYKQSNIWNGMKRRQSLVSADDLIERLKETRLTRE